VDSDIQRDLQQLEVVLRQLEAEYNMFFAGRLPKPPWETRSRVEGLIKQYDRAHIPNTGDRFRFATLQSRFAALVDLWDRGLRAREEGRPGPFAGPRSGAEGRQPPPEDRVVGARSFRDPLQEMDKLHDLYESLSEARHAVGEQPLPFHRFADLIREQVARMQAGGSREVAFRVAVKDGKASLTARAIRTDDEN
jgi:hypothetical protein